MPPETEWPQGAPGSNEAIAAGCRCARIDNSYGKGYRYVEGRPQQWAISGDCPVHGAVKR